MKIVIVAGGTGGHIYSGVAIAEGLLGRDHSNNILFISDKDGLGERLLKEYNFNVKLIWARGILRKISYKAISAPFLALAGFFQSLFILGSFRPSFVVLTGGYVSFPAALAAKILKIKTLLHEQNVLPGVTCRLLNRIVDVTALSFEQSLSYIKGEIVGNPVRQQIKAVKRKSGWGRKILVVGGSQGAYSLNTYVLSNLEKFTGKNVEIFHIIGERDFDKLARDKSFNRFPFYRPVSYLYNIEKALADADIVVSRAGATAVAEFLVLGLPSILVPYPYSSERHQEFNAKALEDAGAGIMLKDEDLYKLPQVVFDLIDDSLKLETMSRKAQSLAKTDAAWKIADLIYANA